MSQPQAILDYASPGRAGRFRVGSQSVIRVFDRGECVQIVEQLENRGLAVGAILFDFAVICLMFSIQWKYVLRLLNGRGLDGSLLFIVFIALIMLVIMCFAVLHNWSITRLEANEDKLTVSFSNPIRKKSLEAARAAIHTIDIEADGAGGTQELRILSTHYDLRLFTGHPYSELLRFQAVLKHALQLRDGVDEIPYAHAVE